MSKKINRKELFLSIYNNIRFNKEKYYVPIINSGTNPTLQDVFSGSDRLFFVENGLYFISEKVLDSYKSIFPKNLIFISINENEFNLILEDICLKVLFLYVSYLFSFKILMLTGLVAFLILTIVFIFLNTLCDIMVRGIIHYIVP